MTIYDYGLIIYLICLVFAIYLNLNAIKLDLFKRSLLLTLLFMPNVSMSFKDGLRLFFRIFNPFYPIEVEISEDLKKDILNKRRNKL